MFLIRKLLSIFLLMFIGLNAYGILDNKVRGSFIDSLELQEVQNLVNKLKKSNLSHEEMHAFVADFYKEHAELNDGSEKSKKFFVIGLVAAAFVIVFGIYHYIKLRNELLQATERRDRLAMESFDPQFRNYELEEEVRNQNQRLQQNQNTNFRLQQDLNQARNQLQETDSQLQRATNELQQHVNELAQTRNQLQRAENRLAFVDEMFREIEEVFMEDQNYDD